MIPGLEQYECLFHPEIIGEGASAARLNTYDQLLYEILAEPFTIEDVCRIIYAHDFEDSEDGMVGVFELYDGRFIRITYSPGYTFDSHSCEGALSEEDIIRYGMTKEERERAGFILDELD